MSDTQKHTKLNVPNLRFPGFEGEWERMKVSDLLEFFSTNSLSWEQLEFEGTGLLNLHYGLIHNGLPNQIDINNSSLPVVKAGFEPRKFTLCKTGDIAFADASEDTDDVGKVVEFVDCAGKDVVCGLHTIHGRDKLDKTVPGFKGYAFSSKVFHDQIKRIAQGTKVFSIRASNFDEVYISIPRMEEQRKIATLLSLIDLRISVQNKVIEKYESLIKALSRRLIPNEGDDYAALETLVHICKGEQLNGECLSDNGKYYVMNGGITPSGYYDDYNTLAGTISISEGGNSCGFVQFNEMPFWSGGHCYTLLQTSDERIQYKFLYHFLKSKQDDIMSLRIGSGLPNIQKKDLGRYPVPILSHDSQTAITRLLDVVCQYIKNERAILNDLTVQKQYVLQAMFI